MYSLLARYPRLWLASLLLMFGVIGALYTCSRFDKAKRSRQVKADYLARCDAGAECQSRVEANHEDCFGSNDKGGTRTSRGYFDDQGYERCMELGETAWLEERRALRKKRARERRNALGP